MLNYLKNKILNNKYLVFVILLSVFIFIRWISFSIFTHSDWWFFWSDTLIEQLKPTIWLNNINFGFLDSSPWKLPLNIVYGIWGVFKLNSNFIDKLFVFWPVILLTPIVSYSLIKKIFNSDIASVIGSIIFTFNSYFLAISTQGHILLILADSLAVLALIVYMKEIKRDKPILIWTILSLFLVSIYDFRSFYMIMGIICLYTLYSFYTYDIKLNKKLLVLVSSSMFVLLLLNFYWLLTFLNITNNSSLNEVLSRGLFGNDFWTLKSALTLHHPFWNFYKPKWFITTPIPFFYWITPIFAFIGFYLNRKNKNVIFFGLILLIGILLTKQVDKPFPNLYLFLYNHVPGFNAFREASKFYFLIALGYSVLISSLVTWLSNNWNSNKRKIYSKYLLFFIIILVFLSNTQSIITGRIGTLFVAKYIPNDYIVLNKFFNNKPEYFRYLSIPTDSRWNVYTSLHPKISAVSAIGANWSSFIDTEIPENDVKNRLYHLLSSNYAKDLLNISSVKYIIIPIQDISNDDDFFEHYGGKENPNIRNDYITIADNLNYLQKIDIGTKNLLIYENKDYKPYIYSFVLINQFSSINNLNNKFDFTKIKLNRDFNFIIGTSSNNTFPFKIKNSFEDIKALNISGATINMKFDDIVNPTLLASSTKNILLSTSTAQTNITYQSSVPLVNSIQNPSFETGFWQQSVGDCNAYDDNKKLDMNINNVNKTDGNNSLQLEATNHIACTINKINIKPNKKYLLSFDYQSDNASEAGYYLGFNAGTSTSRRIAIKNKDWNNFTNIIETPTNASTTDLFIYSYSKDGKENIITRYDNFHLIELPDDILDYWLVSDPQTNFVDPQSITFDLNSPTKKTVYIKGATTPFYLSMSEAYHDQWQLEMNNSKVQGTLSSWWPWAHPDAISQDQHFKLNDFLNGWYVDTNELCVVQHYEGCTQNADGSYDLEMVIEFTPQRWFYVGLIISGTTLAAILGYLGYDMVKRVSRARRTKKSVLNNNRLIDETDDEIIPLK